MTLKKALTLYTNRAWQRYLVAMSVSILAVVIALIGLIKGAGLLKNLTDGYWFFIAVVIALPIAVLKLKASKARFSLQNSAEWFNRHYPQLQYSCQLALLAHSELNLLQRLQLQKIESVFTQLLKQHPDLLYPSSQSLKKRLLLLPVAVVFYLLMGSIGLSQWGVKRELSASEDQKAAPKPHLSYTTQVQISPPSYSQLPAQQVSVGDLSVLEGSRLTWQIKFNQRNSAPKLRLGEQTFVLQSLDEQLWQVSQVITHTQLYQLIGDDGVSYSPLHGIAVNQDQAPSVRMIEPSSTLVVFGKNQQPQLSAKALVQDDFAISDVQLVASLAKGSGEAVKFRDLQVRFDGKQTTPQGDIYSKTWDFVALGMEVGDELYFSAHATDNKAPIAQVSRSNTIIVRWLDDVEHSVAADGMLLNNVPEYFRSQRQIIIETEQLIADMSALSQEQIDEKSRSLGQSQQDLKLRYGQYLGDEVGQGPGEQAQLIGGMVEHASDGEHDDHQVELPHQEQDHQKHDHQQHDHQEHGQQGINPENSLGNAQSVKETFAHAHEAVHVGEVSSQNPKAMMKKAVGFMWQAELHLMLSAPQKALPFEQQAYKYLKLAKQAERIYVKRLGFEPPPVSEEKRLTGSLDEVESYQSDNQIPLTDADELLFAQVYQLFNQGVIDSFDNTQRQLLERLKARFSELAQLRPALIHEVLAIEKMLLANGPSPLTCQSCGEQLSAKLWQFIETPPSGPTRRQGLLLDQDELAKAFLQKVAGQL